jgi:hypothetical protein
MMNLENELYEALVDAGVSKDKARDVKTDLQFGLTELRNYVDGRFDLVGEQMTSMTNRIVIRLGALMVVLTALLGTVLALMRR